MKQEPNAEISREKSIKETLAPTENPLIQKANEEKTAFSKPIDQLLNDYEQSPIPEEVEEFVLNASREFSPIENDMERALRKKPLEDFSSDQLLKFQLVKLKRTYLIEKRDCKRFKIQRRKPPVIKVDSYKFKAINLIIYNESKEFYEKLANQKDGDEYVDMPRYYDKHYVDPNDAQFRKTETVEYFETEIFQSIASKKFITTEEEYEDAKNRNVYIWKRQFNTKLHSFIKGIIDSYEKDGKSIFDDFETTKNFVKNRIKEYFLSLEQSLNVQTYRDITNTSLNHHFSIGTSKVSREITRQENQLDLFNDGLSIEIGNNKKNCNIIAWLEPCEPQLPSDFVNCLYDKKICVFDNALSDVLGSFFNSKNFAPGRSFVSEDSILEKMSGGNPNAYQNKILRDRMRQSVIRMDATRVKLDYSALIKINAFNGKDKDLSLLESCSRYERALNVDPGIIRTKNGKTTKGYFLNQVPLLYRISEALNQRTTIDEKYFNIPGIQNTPDMFLILHYLIKEITRRNSPQGALFKNIIKNSGVESFNIEILNNKKKKYAFKNKIKKIFDNWKKTSFILNYELENDKVTWEKPGDISISKYKTKAKKQQE